MIYGAGVIGLTYAWVLSSKHDVSVLVKPDRSVAAQGGYRFTVHDIRKNPKRNLQFDYQPNHVTNISGSYDAIPVTVNRYQLKSVLPFLKNRKADIIFMQNHWDIQNEIAPYLKPCQYLIGFPSQVGGGREDNRIEVNLYGEGTILGETDGQITERIVKYKKAFEQASLTVEIKKDILGWLKVHYLQQSISAGAILKSGSYDAFANSYNAVKDMVFAFREGIAVCNAYGLDTKKIFPANMFSKPAPIVALAMKSMFNKPDTVLMITGHMKHGLEEWIVGYYEVLKSSEEKGVAVPVWKSYKPYVDDCVRESGLAIPSP